MKINENIKKNCVKQLAICDLAVRLETARTVVETAGAAVLQSGTRIDASMLKSIPDIDFNAYKLLIQNEDVSICSNLKAICLEFEYFMCKKNFKKKGTC